jgi:predicted phosphodiesterase
MKIQILSDLHNEFNRDGKVSLQHRWSGSIPDTDAELVILAGDIDNGIKGAEWAVSESERLAKPVIYVPGNHEYYGHEYFSSVAAISEVCQGSAVHCLNPGVYIQPGLRIIGATLWTDYLAYSAMPKDLVMFYVERSLVDHRLISFVEKDQQRRFLPADALALHEQELAFITQQLSHSFTGKTIVVTHHGPHPVCQHPGFAVSEMSSAFHSDLGAVLERYDIDLWIFGHTHANLDTMVFDTRILSNQAGYPGEKVSGFDATFSVEL